jgi:hypothetical protein
LTVALALYADATAPLRNVSTGGAATLLIIPLLPLIIAMYCTFHLGLAAMLIFHELKDVFVFGTILICPFLGWLRFYCCQRGTSPEGTGTNLTRRGKVLRLIRVILFSWVVVYVSIYTVEKWYLRDTDFTTFLRYDCLTRQDKSKRYLPTQSGVVELGPFFSSPVENELQLDRFMRRQGFTRYIPDLSKRQSVQDSYARIFRENTIESPETMMVAEYHGVVVMPWSANYLPTYGFDIAIVAFSADNNTYRCLITYYPPAFP